MSSVGSKGDPHLDSMKSDSLGHLLHIRDSSRVDLLNDWNLWQLVWRFRGRDLLTYPPPSMLNYQKDYGTDVQYNRSGDLLALTQRGNARILSEKRSVYWSPAKTTNQVLFHPKECDLVLLHWETAIGLIRLTERDFWIDPPWKIGKTLQASLKEYRLINCLDVGIHPLFHPTNSEYLCSSRDGHNLWVWNLETFQPLFEKPGYTSRWRSAVAHPSEESLFTLHQYYLLHWDLRDRRRADLFSENDGETMAISPSGQTLLIGTGTRRKCFLLWERRMEKPFYTYRVVGNGKLSATSVAFDPFGERLVLGLSNGDLQIRHASDGRLIEHLSLIQGTKLTSLSFHPSGRRVALGFDSGTVQIFDVNGLVLEEPLG